MCLASLIDYLLETLMEAQNLGLEMYSIAEEKTLAAWRNSLALLKGQIKSCHLHTWIFIWMNQTTCLRKMFGPRQASCSKQPSPRCNFILDGQIRERQ